MQSICSRISKGGEAKLALRLSSGALKGSGAATARALAEDGFLVAPGGSPGGGEPIRSWKFEGLEETSEGPSGGPSGVPSGVLLYGPSFDGSSLDEARSLGDSLSALLSVAKALAALGASGRLPRGIVSSGILVAGAGEVLVLPPAAAAKALESLEPESRDSAAARLQSPLAKDAEADASFLLAQAAYRFAAGGGAFGTEAAEKGHLASPRRRSTAVALACPRLDRGLAAAIDSALEDPARVGLGAWIAVLEKAESSGWERALAPEEESELERRRVQTEAAADRKRKREAFFRKRGGVLIGAAIALAVAGFVAGDILRAQAEKPNFSKLAPAELAERYYAALDGLDLDSLEACGGGDAIKDDRGMVMNLVVLTKTRMAYEGKSPVVAAKAWVAQGKPPLKDGDFLYGVAGLAVEGAPALPGDGPELRRFAATYSLWSLDRTDDPSGDPSKAKSFPKEEKRVDQLALRHLDRLGWRIVELRRTVEP